MATTLSRVARYAGGTGLPETVDLRREPASVRFRVRDDDGDQRWFVPYLGTLQAFDRDTVPIASSNGRRLP